MIELRAREGGETREVLAKIDTGAGYSSIDQDLAENLSEERLTSSNDPKP